MRWEIVKIGSFFDVRDEHGYLIVEDLDSHTAHLIAAAPELLEMLELTTDQLAAIGDTRDYFDGRIISRARKVIAKAKGIQ
jgi:sulfur relay (sulfurtransferase) DsrC/TusE family protein